jgi:hypothetical protein
VYESKWICEKCVKEFDLENREGWVRLAGDHDSYRKGKPSPLVPYENVCFECADGLLAIVEKCDKPCQY